ncbi:MAG TPA: hypothetical protein PKN95_00290 [Verrucomicrobiota bacterium]|nr:hypothetical protein [Verrucomicrobiota bacterium]HNT14446.1 hypothetical protein [Verrucomicrobiota bacterium]
MKLNQALKVLSLTAILALGAQTVMAQDGGNRPRRNRDGQDNNQRGEWQGRRGNFDPAEMRQRMLERTREELEITDDTEWKAIEPLITKVGEARMAIGFGRFGGRGGPGGPGGFGANNPAAETLQKVIDAKASNKETKAALAKYVADRKARQARLEQAQEDLRKVLTPRQEAIATLRGLL